MSVVMRQRPARNQQHLSGEPAMDAVVREVVRLRALSPAPWPERLAAMHNPWSNTAVRADRWAFLDLCQSPAILDGVKDLLGPDVVLWDSQLYLRGVDYEAFANAGREGRYWPVYPLDGAVAIVSFDNAYPVVHRKVSSSPVTPLALSDADQAVYVIRYFAGSSKFARDPRYPVNWIAMEEQVLLNYTSRALWLVAGKDRAGNDFVTGFSEQIPSWKLRN
jgi:hypothetical protein